MDLRYDAFKEPNAALRSQITGFVERTPIAATLTPSTKMTEVLDSLVHYYGVNPTQLPNLRAYLDNFEKRYGDLEVNQLSQKEVSESGFFGGSRSSTLYSHLESRLTQHPGIVVDESAGPRIADLVQDIRESISLFEMKHASDFAAWQRVSKEVRDWPNWSFETWRTLGDDCVSEWDSMMAGFKSIDRSYLEAHFRGTTVRGAVVKMRDFLKDQDKAAESTDARASLYSIPVRVPVFQLLLLFPFLFVLSTAALRILAVQQRIVAIRVASVEHELSAIVGDKSGAARLFSDELLNIRSAVDYLVVRQWSQLHDNNPSIFSTVAFGFATWSLALFLLERWLRLIWGQVFTMAAWFPYTIVFFFLCVVSGSEFISRKISSNVLQTALKRWGLQEGARNGSESPNATSESVDELGVEGPDSSAQNSQCQ